MKSSKYDKCSFWLDVVCPYKKGKASSSHMLPNGQRWVVMDKCVDCLAYKKFISSMEAEEKEFAEFEERVRADPKGYAEGRIR